MSRLLKKLKIELSYDPASHYWVYAVAQSLS